MTKLKVSLEIFWDGCGIPEASVAAGLGAWSVGVSGGFLAGSSWGRLFKASFASGLSLAHWLPLHSLSLLLFFTQLLFFLNWLVLFLVKNAG